MIRLLIAVAATLAVATAAQADERVGPLTPSIHDIYDITPPSKAELTSYLTRGTAIVSGRLRLTLHGAGVRRTYQGVPVFLLPKVTAAYDFASAIDEVIDDPKTPMASLDRTLAVATRRTLSNADGTFTFTDVPAGAYLVVASILNVDLSTRVVHDGSQRVHDYSDDYLGIEYYHVDTYHHDVAYPCTVNASMQAVLDVAAGQNIVTPLAMTAWSYQNDCDAMNLDR
jgi:hypothetical protein